MGTVKHEERGGDERNKEDQSHVSKVWWIGLLLGVAAAQAPGQAMRAKVPGPGRPVQARSAATALPAETSSALVAMQARAAVIFAGYVVSVDREDAAGYVDVRFRVEEAVRGCNKLGVYVLREWAGLWSGGAARYRVGQRLLMLLPARGPGGMSAPVDGLDGAIPIVASAAEPLADAKGVAPAEDGQGGRRCDGDDGGPALGKDACDAQRGV